jgi:hypothetical protein
MRIVMCRCDIMIHTANEFTAEHHRYLLSGTILGLQSLAGGEAGQPGQASAADKGKHVHGVADSKASTAAALPRCAL